MYYIPKSRILQPVQERIIMKKHLNKIWFVALIAFICCELWGSAFPVIKIGYRQFGITDSGAGAKILFAGVRFTLAGILSWVAGSLIARKPLLPRNKDIPRIAALSLFQTILQYTFFYLGLANCTGVKSSIIDGSNPFVVIIITTLILRWEKMTLRKLLGCLLGFAGIVVINIGGDMAGFAWNGEGFIFLSVLSYAASNLLIKRFSGDGSDPVTLSALQFVLGGVVMILIGLLSGGGSAEWKVTPTGLVTLIHLGMVSAVAYSLWGILLKHNPVSRVAVFGFLTPVCGVLLSALLLGETEQAFRLTSVISLLLVCSGICLVNIPERHAVHPAPDRKE